MGIPSVKKFELSMKRKYLNINSTHKFIPGDRKIAEILDVNKTSLTSDKSILLAQGDINTTGDYSYTITEMHTATSDYYKDGYYDEDISGSTTITINEKTFSLLKPNGVSQNTTFDVNHFFDKDSYNNVGTSSMISKLSLTDIYQIKDTGTPPNIEKLGSNVGSIEVEDYSNHTTMIEPWTLLYLDGKFRTNANLAYPDVSHYQYNSVSIPNKY